MMAVVIHQQHFAAARQGQRGQLVEAAADALEALQRTRDRRIRHAQLPADGGRGERVLHVVAARQGQRAGRAAAVRQAQGEVHARALLAHIGGAHVGFRCEAVGHHVARGGARQLRHLLVIDAQHGQAIERQPVQELGEGLLHPREVAAVVLQVVGIDIGDDRRHRVQA